LIPWIGPVSRSPRGRVRVAVATRPRDFGAADFFRLTDGTAAFFRLTDEATAFLRLTDGAAAFLRLFAFATDTFFLAGAFFPDFFFAADFFETGFFFVGFFLATDFLRVDAFFKGFFFDEDFFLVTLVFFPAAFIRDDDLRDAAFLRAAAALVRFLLAAFLAGIIDSCRSEKNAGLYIDFDHMEAQ
jgi:hypothetical protein